MKKTFCDRCGAPADNKEIQRFIMFDVNKAMDLCDPCYSQLCKWLINKDSTIYIDYPTIDYPTDKELVEKVLERMKQGDLDGAGEVIKKSREDCKDCKDCQDDGGDLNEN